MIVVQLEAALLAVPNYARSNAEAEDLFQRLLYWLRVLHDEVPITLARSDGALEALANANCFPTRDDVEVFLQQFNLVGVYSAGDVWTAYLTLLERCTPASEISGVEVASCSCTGASAALASLFPSDLHDETVVAQANACFQNQFDTSRLWFVGGALPLSQMGVTSLVAEDLTFAGEQSVGITQTQAAGMINLVTCVEDILKSTSPADVWNVSRTAGEIHLSVALNAIALGLCGWGELAEVPTFAVGSAFTSSLASRQAGPGGKYAARTLETCSRAIGGSPKHPLKAFGRPNQLSRQKDGALALRTHITKKSAALRLMLWSTDWDFELANVGRKSELLIEHGDSALGFKGRYPSRSV